MSATPWSREGARSSWSRRIPSSTTRWTRRSNTGSAIRPTGLRASLERAGFHVERLLDFNRTSVPAWFVNGGLLKRRTFSRIQLKGLELMMPAVRRLDRLIPWHGLSVVGIGVKQ